ncbi:MAG: KilA-N domain-containing protein [Bacilli bacterium]|nr:KilA-N domain-containing protein [Bacilli bacterium]
MKNNIITTEMVVKETKVGVMRVGNVNYISLTDLAKYQNSSDPSFTVKNWLRRITTIDYIGLWEEIHNDNFNLVEFDQIKTEYGRNSFAMSPTQWIKRTNAIGIISKGGRYSIGTYAHPDIAFEFASWLSPEFKLYLITEFERLKTNEAYQRKIDWQANRLLSKLNYIVHTDAIKNNIVPELTEKQKKLVYAEEADVLNVALFGMTAKEWREKNPKLAEEGNMRDYTDLLHLIILNNLQNTNAQLIEENISQKERLIKLNNIARRQMEILKYNKNIKELETLQKQVNDDRLMISDKD